MPEITRKILPPMQVTCWRNAVTSVIAEYGHVIHTPGTATKRGYFIFRFHDMLLEGSETDTSVRFTPLHGDARPNTKDDFNILDALRRALEERILAAMVKSSPSFEYEFSGDTTPAGRPVLCLHLLQRLNQSA